MSPFFKTPIRRSAKNEHMSIHTFFLDTASDVVGVVKGADTADLGSATPCTEFELKKLVNHFIGTTGALARAGRRESLDPEDPYGSKKDSTGGDWQSVLAANIEDLGRAWTQPEAWQGSVDLGSASMPARMIGEMAYAELVLHGWDLARATGQELTVPEDVAAELRRSIEETAELGRSMGAYGDAVDVSDGESEFARALGASGRDPRWPER